ncbi:MAG: response regulator transcription factor [Bacteroidota bacterium]
MKQVLVIEDDPAIVDLLDIHLRDLGCQLHKAYDGDVGLKRALNENFDLYILDLMVPGTDGLEICRQIRAKEIHTPVLMLTAKSEEIDKVLGLEIGADDYLTKPFSVREFIARVKALFRRVDTLKPRSAESIAAKSRLHHGALCIDLDKRKVTLQNKRVELSPKEFDLLSLLAAQPGKSFDRKRLLNLVWGYDFEGYEHTVNSHINRLRRKIEPDLQEPQYILTTWGIGYRFNEEIG